MSVYANFFNEAGAHQKYSDQQYGKYKDAVKQRNEDYDKAYDKQAHKKFFQRSTLNKDLDAADAKLRAHDKEFIEGRKYDTKNDSLFLRDPKKAQGDHNIEKREAKKEFQRRFGSAEPKNKALHDKINARSKGCCSRTKGCSCRESFVTEEAYANFFCEAKYSIIPKFGESSKVKELYNIATEAQEYADNLGEINSQADAAKASRHMLKVCAIIEDICGLGMGILTAWPISGLGMYQLWGIPVYLCMRLLSWMTDESMDTNAKRYAREVLGTYKRMRANKNLSKKDKEKLDEYIAKIEDALIKMDK